ncbi:unnamed protein product [Symbiodinium sp. CCMP2592]|nr:unnamed protein product [Symbiodinium sp. CCMP2592]
MFDCDIPIPPGGDAAAGTGSACSDHISILANQPGSPSTAAPPATAPAPTPPKVRRCASPPTSAQAQAQVQAQASKPTPTPRTSARTPCNPRVGGPAAAMASPASPRTTSGGYPSSARTGTRPARAPASPPASSSKMESSPPSARRATPGTSSSSSGPEAMGTTMQQWLLLLPIRLQLPRKPGQGRSKGCGGITLRDGALRPPISSRLAALGECADVRCGTHRLAHPEVRPAFVAFAMEQCKAAKLHSEVTALAIGSGGLLFEWEVLEALQTS